MPTSQRPDPSTLRQVQLSSGTSTTRSGSSFTARQTSSYTATTAPDSPQQPRPQLAPGANDSPNECAPPTNRTATTASNLPLLSPPTTAATLSGRAPSPTLPGPVKATRFDRSALHDHWTRFKRTTGFGPPGPLTGTGTGTGSSSLEESGADEEGRNYTHKGSGGVRWGRVVARTITSDGGGSRETGPLNRGGRVWGRRKWRDEDMEMGRSVAGSVDHAQYKTRRGTNASLDGMGDDECDDAEVDAVVVDNQFLSLDKSTQRSQSTHPHHADETGTPPTGPTGSTSSGVAESRAMVMLRYRIWPVVERFFSLHFHDPISEAQYSKETFYTNKTLTFWAACFLILNWLLAAALLSKPYSLHDEIVIFGVIPFLTVPLPIFITFDWPRTRPWFYQVWLACTVWCWGFYNVFLMYLCGVYGQPKVISCGNRDFLVLFYYVTGLPVIAIFAMGQNRTLQTFMVVTFIAISGGMLLPWRRSWIRNTLNLIIYHAFVLYINWMRETAERRLYVLRDQLKTQYKQTQKAQISERKSSDSKRRLTSYIFHEVRVPLNTALLAAQNLAGTNAIQREHEIEFNALEGSLNMMSKVLNDVLDFNRMDSGRFETVSKPFAFHAVIRSMLVPLGLGASAKGLQLIVELDEEIDVQARLAAYRAQAREIDFAQGEKRRTPDTLDRMAARKRAEEWVAQRMEEGSEEDGIVMGDEMRLRQVVTNLASNACKFTESGGHITLRTKLIIPGPETRTRVSIDRPPRRQSESTDDSGKQLEDSNGHSNDHTHVHIAPPLWRGSSGDSNDENRALEHIVVRIEVEDTGVGIGQRDMEEKRLFSAFMQTSSGLRQGGKGTGLGLALVRHIVALSGGRLGVKSKRAVGSTFWVELPLGVGRKAVAGVHATRARDAAVDAINFSGAWNNVDEAVNRSIPEPVASPPVLSSPEGEETPTPMHSGVAPGEIMTSSGDASTGLSSGALLAAGAPLTPLQGGSALRSIMEHGGVVELVPTLSMQASAEEAPIVATRTLSPDSTRQSPGISPGASRAGPSDMSLRMDPSASRAVLSDPTASRIVVTDPRAVTGASVAAQTPTDTRASPKPSAHRSMPSESSLPQLKLSPGVAPGANAPGNASPVKAVGSAESLAPLRVLVVDDDSLTRRLMTRMLTRLGCTVENAENGQIALDMLLAPLPTPQSQRTQSSAGFPPSAEPTHMASASWDYAECKYDIVFLDNHMPVCSGVEVAKRLRQLDRKDFVVGVTGNALTEDQQEYLQAGANHVLTKPVLEKSLKAMLVLADERRKARGT